MTKSKTRETELVEALHEVMCEHFKIPSEDIRPEADLFDDLGLDSLDMLTAVTIIEERFGFEVADEELTNVRTVGAALAFFETKLHARG